MIRLATFLVVVAGIAAPHALVAQSPAPTATLAGVVSDAGTS